MKSLLDILLVANYFPTETPGGSAVRILFYLSSSLSLFNMFAASTYATAILNIPGSFLSSSFT